MVEAREGGGEGEKPGGIVHIPRLGHTPKARLSLLPRFLFSGDNQGRQFSAIIKSKPNTSVAEQIKVYSCSHKVCSWPSSMTGQLPPKPQLRDPGQWHLLAVPHGTHGFQGDHGRRNENKENSHQLFCASALDNAHHFDLELLSKTSHMVPT